MSSVQLLKSKKRALFKSRLQQLRHKNLNFSSINLALAKNLFNLNIFEGQKTIASYCALPGEISPLVFEQKSLKKSRFVFPQLKEQQMVFLPVKGKWGVAPKALGYGEDQPLRPVWDIDIFLVPGLAFDREGRRLGRGAGHYDRFLAKNKGSFKIGLAHHFQVFDKALPEENHDIRMDVVVTELNFFVPIYKSRAFFNKWLI